MTEEQLEAVVQGITDAVLGHVRGEIATVLAKLAQVETKALTTARDGKDGKDGVDGKDAPAVTPEQIGIAVKTYFEANPIPPAQKGRDGIDGKDAPPVSSEQIAAAVAAHLEAHPPPAGSPGRDGVNGKDAEPVTNQQIADLFMANAYGLRNVVAHEVDTYIRENPIPVPKDGSPGEKGEPGKDADPVSRELVLDALRSDEALLGEAVKSYLDLHPIPVPKDGTPGRDGKDGVGVAGALLDREGELVLTLSDGSIKGLGRVVGATGTPGKDGLDGLGFDDMTPSFDGERTVTLTWSKGERTKEFSFAMPIVIYRGVWDETKTYEPGESVTWGGSMWIAKERTTVKPGTGPEAKAWQLAVKRGAEGPRGVKGEQGLRGPAGPLRGTT